jgi:predicted permease
VTPDSLAFRLVAILFPIFGIVAAGYFYARHHKPEMAVANRLNMDVFVPALVFAAMAGSLSTSPPMRRWPWAASSCW